MGFITLDREREVRLKNKAISLIERRYKKLFFEMMQEPNKLTVDEQIYILYTSLKHEDPELTLQQVEDIVDEHSNMGEVLNLIIDAAFEAYGTNREEAEKRLMEKIREFAEKEVPDDENPKQAAE